MDKLSDMINISPIFSPWSFLVVSGVLSQESSPVSSSFSWDHSHPGHIQVKPFNSLFHEILQERSSLRWTSFGLSWRVCDISEFVLDQVPMVVLQRHMPDLLMDLIPRNLERIHQILTIGEGSCVSVAEGEDHGSSESGELDHDLCILICLLSPVHAVGKNKSAFSISVADLDSDSLSALDDVGRPVGVVGDKVLNPAAWDSEVDLHSLFHNGLEGWETSNSSTLIQKHVLHSSGWITKFVLVLMFRPPESKQTPFPTKATQLSLSLFPLYLMFTKVGSYLLALPTACISRKPLSRSSFPFSTVISSPCFPANSRASL